MITEIVTFKVPEGTTREQHRLNSEESAVGWSENPDLIRKNYIFDPETGIAGGVYLWKERAHAEKWHGPEWRKILQDLYGAEPESQFFETPVVVDNVAGEIATE